MCASRTSCWWTGAANIGEPFLVAVTVHHRLGPASHVKGSCDATRCELGKDIFQVAQMDVAVDKSWNEEFACSIYHCYPFNLLRWLVTTDPAPFNKDSAFLEYLAVEDIRVPDRELVVNSCHLNGTKRVCNKDFVRLELPFPLLSTVL